MKLEFKNQDEALRWVAKMNEMSFRFELAAKLYRQSGDEEDAQRCDDMAQSNADLDREALKEPPLSEGGK